MNNIDAETLVNLLKGPQFPQNGVSFMGRVVGTRSEPGSAEDGGIGRAQEFFETDYLSHHLQREGRNYCLTSGSVKLRFGIIENPALSGPSREYNRRISFHIDLGEMSRLMLLDLYDIQIK